MNISLSYVEKGSGEPLILLHGNGENHSYFANQIEYFSLWRRVIAIDTRGHGSSPKGTKPFTLDTFVDDLHDFMHQHEIYHADILGFSDGGNIALLFALKYPHRVGKLILNGANLNFFGLTFKTAAWILGKYIQFCIQAPFSSEAENNRDLFRLMVHEPKIKVEELHSIESKTLVIVGKNDMIRASHSRRIAANIKDSKLVTIQGTHFIAAENSTEFNNAVTNFLSIK